MSELKQWLGRRQGEAIAPGYRLNIGILNVSIAPVQCTVSQLGIVERKQHFTDVCSLWCAGSVDGDLRPEVASAAAGVPGAPHPAADLDY